MNLGLIYPTDETTAITWPATGRDLTENHQTFQHISSRASGKISRLNYEGETGDTQNTTSYEYSDASSVFRFPAFHFNLHTLTSLSWLNSRDRSAAVHDAGKTSKKYTILAAVLDIDGPDAIKIKRGADAGKEVALLKLILGDEDGAVCKLTAWRETAETWGGIDPSKTTSALKKGDVVLLESESSSSILLDSELQRLIFLADITASWTVDPRDSTAPMSLTASPYLNSRLEICYRTMPTAPTDTRLRPDLRLGSSDAAVQKVSAVVDWFESIAGLRDSRIPESVQH